MPSSSSRPSAVDPAVDLRQIARRFGHRWALRGVSMTVAPGEAVGILGHNGSGKSTLLRIVATVLRATKGGGTVLGFDIAKDADAVREVLGLLAHNPGLYEDLSARENLVFAARMRGSDPRRIDHLLAEVGLGHVANEPVRTFSSGMQRRVSLARLMLHAPKVLLLDEPYNSFDAEGVALVNRIIADTVAAGGSALVVAHDMARGEQVVDRAVEMCDGVLVDPGSGQPRLVATAGAGAG